MIGVDTSFLVAHCDSNHLQNPRVRQCLVDWTQNQEQLVFCPQVIAEMLHVATDARRLPHAWTMSQAIAQAHQWRTATEVHWVSPDVRCVKLCLEWMAKYALGRKRILDTLLAATYFHHGVTRLATLNPDDFRVFRVFEFLPFPDTESGSNV
jgi:predicted nucleic acid-binding protein